MNANEVAEGVRAARAATNGHATPLDGCVFTARSLMLEEPPPPRQWACRVVSDDGAGGFGVLPLGECGLLAGPAGCGKSSAALGISLAVASGLPALGCIDVPEPGGVFYVSTEDRRDELARRLLGYGKRYRPDQKMAIVAGADRLRVAVRPSGASWAMVDRDGRPTPFAAALHAAIAGAGPLRLVVIDTLNRVGNDEIEKSPSASRQFVEQLEQLCALPGQPSVLLLHHSRKPERTARAKETEPEMDADDIRGTSGLVGAVRFALVLSPRGDGLRLAVVKSNYGSKGGVDLERHAEVLWRAVGRQP